MLISRKRYKIETNFQWKTNRKSYVAYRMAPVLVTLNDLEGHSRVAGLFKCNPSNISAVFLPDFHWQRARAVPQRQLGFLSLSVKLRGWRTVSGKLLVFGFLATMRLLSNYFDLLWQYASIQVPLGTCSITCWLIELPIRSVGTESILVGSYVPNTA